MADSNYLYTGSSLEAGTNTGLSTQILVKIDGKAVGAIQSLTATQTRRMRRINEVGTDGVIEIVPQSATEIVLRVERIVFMKKGLPESFNRAYTNIHAQRVPFDIFVYDFTNAKGATLDNGFFAGDSAEGVITTVYENCWFNNLEIRYQASDYIVAQNASIDAEYVRTFANGDVGTSVVPVNADNNIDPLERLADIGRRGSMDARGLTEIAGLFNS
jgi:hypothetical protein